MKRRTDMRERDDAVSPVIGVMLILMVTIIIAAVVSGFAGGVFSAQSPAPTISAKAEYSLENGLNIDVLSTSEVIDTKDLKIQLDSLADGQRLSATITADRPQDINGTGAGVPYKVDRRRSLCPFGEFNLKSGVQMSGPVTLRSSQGEEHDVSGTNSIPDGACSDEIAPDEGGQTWGDNTADDLKDYDKLNWLDEGHSKHNYMVKLNDGWSYDTNNQKFIYYPGTKDLLKIGDKISIKIVYLPNGQTIYSSDVKVVS